MMKFTTCIIGFLAMLQVMQAQDTIVMPATGNGGFYNTCYALIMDDGADSNYTANGHSRITISTLWTQSVSLYFEEFDTEVYFDSLTIYDGPGITFPRLGTYSGNSLQGQAVSSTGSSITLEFVSDDIQAGSGFKAWVSCLAGNEVESGEEWKVYPNPAKDKIKIGLPALENIRSVWVSDLHGKQFGLPFFNGEADLSGLPGGMYMLNIVMQDGTTFSKKLVKTE